MQTRLHPYNHALELVGMKSDHQGGEGRFLVIYNTEHGFWLDPLTIERMRRALQDAPPRFERVYYVSIHDPGNGSVSEIYPGTPHHIFGEADLDAMRVAIPHPAEFRVGRTASWSGIIMHGGNRFSENGQSGRKMLALNFHIGSSSELHRIALTSAPPEGNVSGAHTVRIAWPVQTWIGKLQC